MIGVTPVRVNTRPGANTRFAPGLTDVRQGRDAWHRHSIRLPDYDYARNGAYFITICIQERACLLGSIVDGVMRPTDAGDMVVVHWEDLPSRFPGLTLDAYVVMPNHFHGILLLDERELLGEVGQNMTGEQGRQGERRRRGEHDGGEYGVGEHEVRPYIDHQPRRGESCIRPEPDTRLASRDLGNGTADGSVGRIVQALKSLTTNAYIRGVKTLNWPEYHGRLWQRNYYDHIVRDEADLERIRTYIDGNPANWSTDDENPALNRAPIPLSTERNRNAATQH